jgi:hypothetical protein
MRTREKNILAAIFVDCVCVQNRAKKGSFDGKRTDHDRIAATPGPAQGGKR